ncbi:MAG TPA: hypothetical protein VHZ97_27760 [Pseudonocardiaceae bacterium]|nr:hypothetical protein [Pseudonocardiaceae bacterium]
MTTVVRRICLALLALYGAYAGLWGYFAPSSWYRGFPGLGVSWLPAFGPYNEHFVKDINAMFLGLAVLSVVAFCWIGSRSLTNLAGATWLTFNALHTIYHLRHLDMFAPSQRIVGVLALAVVLLLTAPLLVPSRQNPVPGHRRGQRIVLAFLFLTGAGTGFWAYFAPQGWYDTFPGFGVSWLPQLGPFNEHFAVDVGAMFLAYAMLSGLALLRVHDVVLVRAAGLTWLVFNVLHLVYHLTMLGMYRPVDQVLNVVVLVIEAVLPIFLLVSRNQSRGTHVNRTQSGTGTATRPARVGTGGVPGHDAAGNGQQEGS